MLTLLLAAAGANLVVPVPQRPVAAAGPRLVEVDCGAGQRLDDALRKVKGVPDATILVRGTCVGNFAVESADGLSINGPSLEEAVLEAPPDGPPAPILDVRDSRRVMVGNVTLRGGLTGLAFRRSPGSGLANSLVQGNMHGLVFSESGSGAVWNCDVRDNGFGVEIIDRSVVAIEHSTIRNSGMIGVDASFGSSLDLQFSEISGSLVVGLELYEQSAGELFESTLRDNGSVHVVAIGGSRIAPSHCALGADGDRTRLAVALLESTFEGRGGNVVFGPIHADWNSFVHFLGVTVRGDVVVAGFSKALLEPNTVLTSVTCASGGDAACTLGATAPVSGCASASACGATAAEPATPDRMREAAASSARLRESARRNAANVRSLMRR